MTELKSKAARVLSTSDDPDALSVASYVLRDDIPKPARTKRELQRLLRSIDGKEGQTERCRDIRAMLEVM